LGVLAVVAIVCCVGLPLIAAAGVSVVVDAWVGGIALAALALTTAVVLLVVRAGRHHSHRQRHPILRPRA
jgi:hypothetical protein